MIYFSLFFTWTLNLFLIPLLLSCCSWQEACLVKRQKTCYSGNKTLKITGKSICFWVSTIFWCGGFQSAENLVLIQFMRIWSKAPLRHSLQKMLHLLKENPHSTAYCPRTRYTGSLKWHTFIQEIKSWCIRLSQLINSTSSCTI